MSIVRQLVQVSGVWAMREGETLAGQNFHDSKIESLSDALKTARVPVGIISVEESDSKDDGGNEEGFFGRPVMLKMQVQISIFELTEDPDDPGEVLFTLGVTDAAMEGMLNILDWQWKFALTDPRGGWGEIFRGLVQRIGRVRDMRAIDPEVSRRHALRLYEVELECIADPVPGLELPPEIEAGLLKLEGIPDYQKMAAKWRALFSKASNLPDWQRTQASMFGSRKMMDALGLGPLDVELTDFDRAIIDVEGVSGVTEVEVDV